MSLKDECCVAVWKKGVGLALNDREIKALQRAVREVFMTTDGKPVASFEEAVDSILAELRAVMIAKQKDYGPRNILDCGEVGVLIRANDKLARLRNLYGVSDGTFKTKPALNESTEDSWTDLANYAIIAKMLRRGIFDRPLGIPVERRRFVDCAGSEIWLSREELDEVKKKIGPSCPWEWGQDK